MKQCKTPRSLLGVAAHGGASRFRGAGGRLEQGSGSEAKAQSGNGRQRGNNKEGWTVPDKDGGGAKRTQNTGRCG